MAVNDFAVIGLDNIGRSLTVNMKSRQYNVAVFDENQDDAFSFANDCIAKVKAYRDLKSLISSISVPRKIFLSIDKDKIDDIVVQMIPYLGKSDTLIDLSESSYEFAKQKEEELRLKSIRYLDAAVTGPVEEAATGTGFIVGGHDDAFSACSRILRQLSREYKGFASCIHSGAAGTGHYTKLVHDSVEVSLIQTIADAYFMLRTLGEMGCEEISAAFTFINEELKMYLLGMTAEILEQFDEESATPIIDFIMDTASIGQNAEQALNDAMDNKVPHSMAAQAVSSRYLSAQKEQRRISSQRLYAPELRYDSGSIKLLDTVKDAMKSSFIAAYAQGMDALGQMVGKGGWNYGEDEIARVWGGASTIRSAYLMRVHIAFNKNEHLLNMMHDEYFANQLKSMQKGFRETVMLAAKHAIPVPSFMSALSYYDSIRCAVLPANLIQSQLNYMRRDTVRRYDIQGNFNVDWIVEDKKNK